MSLFEFFGLSVVGGFYLFLPAYFANMVPVGASSLARRFSLPNPPIWEAKLGKNKTWVGTLAGFVAAVVVAGIQARLSSIPFFEQLRPKAVNEHSWLRLSLLIAFGALIVGDMGKSFVKRRLDIKPGAPWKPWDDLDFGFGTALVLLPLAWAQPFMLVAGVLIAYGLNPVVNRISHRVGIKLVPH
ncbi:CDP-archaeol synthase [Candidatus Parcubacteria bacterium]|nr:MAG: CDP-archaeol synthase [Candidatus Parcubacteria bacterium]